MSDRPFIILYIVLVIAVLGCLTAYLYIYRYESGGARSAAISSNFQFELATTTSAQERGLGGRADVPENYGMLFVFPEEGLYGFWMKDMSVPIDIIWLSKGGTILGILPEVSTSTYPEAFYPPEPVRYVLETRAGEAARQGWQLGSFIQLPPTS